MNVGDTVYLHAPGGVARCTLSEVLGGDRRMVLMRDGSPLNVSVHDLSDDPVRLHRVNDAATAVAAAKAIEHTIGGRRWEVLCALADRGAQGVADFEYEMLLGKRADATGNRRVELQRMGLCAPRPKSHPEPKRETDRGRWAQVYEITPAGRELWQQLRTAKNREIA